MAKREDNLVESCFVQMARPLLHVVKRVINATNSRNIRGLKSISLSRFDVCITI